jgi:ribonuclease T2
VLVNARRVSGKFDYYVLALSWSPTYCASRAGRRDRQQCGTGRGYAFVVHGLWPQYEKGWPDFALHQSAMCLNIKSKRCYR